MQKHRKEFKLSVCIDVDGVLANYTHWKEGKLGPPNEEGLKLCHMLKDYGFTIIVQTCRTHPGWGPKQFMEQYYQLLGWLEAWKVPYDWIEVHGKAIAHFYVDDRAVHFPANQGPAEDVFRVIMERLEGHRGDYDRQDKLAG